jgi:hypothetical protein
MNTRDQFKKVRDMHRILRATGRPTSLSSNPPAD